MYSLQTIKDIYSKFQWYKLRLCSNSTSPSFILSKLGKFILSKTNKVRVRPGRVGFPGNSLPFLPCHRTTTHVRRPNVQHNRFKRSCVSQLQNFHREYLYQYKCPCRVQRGMPNSGHPLKPPRTHPFIKYLYL